MESRATERIFEVTEDTGLVPVTDPKEPVIRRDLYPPTISAVGEKGKKDCIPSLSFFFEKKRKKNE